MDTAAAECRPQSPGGDRICVLPRNPLPSYALKDRSLAGGTGNLWTYLRVYTVTANAPSTFDQLVIELESVHVIRPGQANFEESLATNTLKQALDTPFFELEQSWRTQYRRTDLSIQTDAGMLHYGDPNRPEMQAQLRCRRES